MLRLLLLFGIMRRDGFWTLDDVLNFGFEVPIEIVEKAEEVSCF